MAHKSGPKAAVQPRTLAALQGLMAALGIDEADLDEQFVRGAGSGGQKINKTSVAVRLTHRPSGLQVRCQATRSQALNRFFARRQLAVALWQSLPLALRDGPQLQPYRDLLQNDTQTRRRRQKDRRRRRRGPNPAPDDT